MERISYQTSYIKCVALPQKVYKRESAHKCIYFDRDKSKKLTLKEFRTILFKERMILLKNSPKYIKNQEFIKNHFDISTGKRIQ